MDVTIYGLAFIPTCTVADSFLQKVGEVKNKQTYSVVHRIEITHTTGDLSVQRIRRYIYGARGGVVVKALRYKPEGRRFELCICL
jgi:hypothetical protein